MSESNGTKPILDNNYVLKAITSRIDLSDLEIRVATLLLSERDQSTMVCSMSERTIALYTGRKQYEINRAIQKLTDKSILFGRCRYNTATKRRTACQYFFWADLHQVLAPNILAEVEPQVVKTLEAGLKKLGMSHLFDCFKLKDSNNTKLSTEKGSNCFNKN